MASLVSVVIATYNSARFVIETLESISSQTWKEIELIITDDLSEDDSIVLCRKWLSNNKNRFLHTEIITTTRNAGIGANLNRGLRIAKGDWIKFLGADDTLKPNCVEDNMLWITSHKSVRVLFSRIEVYKDTFHKENLLSIIPQDPYLSDSIMAPGRSAESQYRMLLISDKIHFTPSLFIHRDTLVSVGGFDERFRLLEDYPLWLNLTKNDNKLEFMDKITVNYRQHSHAINNTGIPNLINPNYFRQESFRKIYTYPYLPADIKLSQRFNWYASQIFRWNWLNRNKNISRIFYSILTSYLNPFKYYFYIKKHFFRNLEANEFYL